MAKIRDILKHVSVEVALRERICHRKRGEHSVPKGERCLVVKDDLTEGKKNYCAACAKDIIAAAAARIQELETELE